jgi:uncharacterized repeat protein (TIGR01451 family)
MVPKFYLGNQRLKICCMADINEFITGMIMKFETLETTKIGGVTLTRLVSNKAAVSAVALMTAFAPVAPAWATIDNTVTATGDSPGGTDDVNATADETVDVEDAAPSLVVTKTADDTTDVAVGQTVNYTYTVENTGNITLTNVGLSDAHEGTGAAPVPGTETLTTDAGTSGDSTDAVSDGVWDTLAPGDIVTWTAAYTVTAADLANQTDNDIDNTVTASATPADGTLGGTLTADEEVDLIDQDASLSVTKVADDDTDVVVGQVITYTYTVTNDGNVPVTNITLGDNVTAGSGTAPTPSGETLFTDNGTLGDSTDAAADGSWDVLGVGDVITFTGTYTVTQDDVDNLQ